MRQISAAINRENNFYLNVTEYHAVFIDVTVDLFKLI
jgi:hypothetical protein